MSLSPAPPARHDGHAPGSTSDRASGRAPALAAVPAGGAARSTALPLRFEGTGRTFGTGLGANAVLRGVDLKVAAGEVVALLGPSGCGKSTLLRSAAGLDRPTEGRVLVGDHEVDGIDDACAVAFQEPRLMPWKSVRENVALGLPRGTTRAAATERVDELLDLVGLAEHATKRPRAISGGMAQRASLARALARRPGVLLLDEPFGALDALTRMRMQDLLLSIHEAAPTTVLLVTHDVDEALQVADRVAVLGRPSPDQPSGLVRLVDVPGSGRGTAAPPTWPPSAPTCSPAWASTPTVTDRHDTSPAPRRSHRARRTPLERLRHAHPPLPPPPDPGCHRRRPHPRRRGRRRADPGLVRAGRLRQRGRRQRVRRRPGAGHGLHHIQPTQPRHHGPGLARGRLEDEASA